MASAELTVDCSPVELKHDVLDGRHNPSEKHDENNCPSPKRAKHDEGEFGSVIAKHYNSVIDKGLTDRSNSRIYHLRNFNNWIKSILIKNSLDKIRENLADEARINVLDIGCGKGGDLLKWKKGRIHHLVCADISETAIGDCQNRFQDHMRRSNYERRQNPMFSAEFITADCTKVSLRDRYKNPDIKFDLVSCQFAFHYCFESLTQAECFLKNAAESLKPGGLFIGSLPDSMDIIKRLREAKQQEKDGTAKDESTANSFGNSVYSVTFDQSFDLDNIALFGRSYDFHLEGVVDCPEFLVHFPTLERLAAKYGLELVEKTRFEEVFHKYFREEKRLLEVMSALETFPPSADTELMGADNEVHEYRHASEWFKHNRIQHENRKVGTLSKSEWEAITLYLTFMFQKRRSAAPSISSPESRKRHSTEATRTNDSNDGECATKRGRHD